MSKINVMASAAIQEACYVLVPRFEQETGHQVNVMWTPTVQMMSRLKGGEVVDLIIMTQTAIGELMQAGVVASGKSYPLVVSRVGMAVRSGAPKPDISSGDALKHALLAAKSIVISTGPSGVYMLTLFDRLGITEQVQPKLKQIQGKPAGSYIASGEAEIGFQQVSELLPVPGIDLVGPLSDDVQQITTFNGGIHARAAEPAVAKALVEYLKAPAAHAIIREKGLQPA